MKTLMHLAIFAFATNSFAGGAVVVGGKTHTAILVYEDQLDSESVKLVQEEIKRLSAAQEMPKLLRYESVTDENGKAAMCAAFFSSIVGTAPQLTLEAIAGRSGAPSAVRSVGSCAFSDSANNGQRFFDSAEMELQLTANFPEIISGAERRGEGQKDIERTKFRGSLTLIAPAASRKIPVTINARGNSNLSECTFPKLKVEFKEQDVQGTPLEGLNGLRINTHCGEPSAAQPTQPDARVMGDRGPARESFVYELLATLKIPSFQSKLARITYQPIGGMATQHLALVIESKKDMGKRLGGKVIEAIDFEEMPNPQPFLDSINRNQVAVAEFFNVLIGNSDRFIQLTDVAGEIKRNYAAPMPPLWNYSLLQATQPVLIPYDFDVSHAVTQQKWNGPLDRVVRKVSGCTDPYCANIFLSIQEIRALFPRSSLEFAKYFYLEHAPRLEKAIAQSSTLQAEEKAAINQRLQAFVDVLKNRIYVPVIAEKGAKLYLDAALTKPCGEDGGPDERVDMTIPVGYVVHEVERTSRSVKVKVLGQLFRPMINPVTGLDCTSQENWIDPQVKISKDFP